MADKKILNEKTRLYPGMLPITEIPKPPVEPEPPLSGRYEGKNGKVEIDFRVDVDELRQFSVVLNKMSGTVSTTDSSLWKNGVKSVYFQQAGRTVKVNESPKKRIIDTPIKCVGVDGTRWSGKFTATFSLASGWSMDIMMNVGPHKFDFKKGQLKSKFFRDVKLDIDFSREKVEWPIFELFRLARKPEGMENRKLDAFSAFEDAGIKLEYNQEHSQKVEDPTPEDPWTKADLYNVMMEHFNSKEKSSNIWCMMGETPPDRRFMGFSFDKNGKRGFGLFLGHRSFQGYNDDSNLKKKARAQRRLLHYLVHECGHCLGLKHPFELGQPNSLSWMNYAWRYDQENGPSSFYDSFLYRFSNDELFILRHSPNEVFMQEANAETMKAALGSKYAPQSDIVDETGTDVNDDIDLDVGEAPKEVTEATIVPARKIGVNLSFKTLSMSVGKLLTAEARVKNTGKLPVVVEDDLNPDAGNLALSVTTPSGEVKVVEPVIKPIKSGLEKPIVLYSASHKEGTDRISELVSIGDTSDGYIFSEPGKYTVKAKYMAGRYSATSTSYTIEVTEPKTESEKKIGYKVAEAASLGGSSYKGFEDVKGYYDSVIKESIPAKKSHVAAMIALLEGMTTGAARSQGSKTRPKPYVTPAKALEDTADLVSHYRSEGAKEDNIYYGKLVLQRSSLYMKEKKTKEADEEFNQMLADLVKRGVKYEALQSISNQYQDIKNPPPIVPKYTSTYLQDKLNEVVSWRPKYDSYDDDAEDYSGFGLKALFNEFDEEQVGRAKNVAAMLDNKYEETKDLDAVLEYADTLQKGREVNYKVLQYSVRSYIVHSDEAHHAGVKYPPPPPRDMELYSQAATISLKRKLEPMSEEWMNYWRNDADFNDHHQHWHSVYNAGSGASPHLLRQGELFGYMHSQMLARYDAERESWGMKPVKAWDYDETVAPCNIGAEFHNDPRNRWYRPRRGGVMQPNSIRRFQFWENNYKNALANAPGNLWKLEGADEYYQLNPDWSGHCLEATSQQYGVMNIGSLHNSGHGEFGSMTEPGMSSYMMSTATAVRDPIFFRWHKRIDTLWQMCNDRWFNNLDDGPPVVIGNNDVVITHKGEQPGGFSDFAKGDWKTTPQIDSVLNTELVEPELAYEWDDKLKHEPFFYHIRFKRKAGSTGDLRLTLRVFICPESVANKRNRWIEMDKFVYSMGANQNQAVITRSDTLSSVIKRDPSKVNRTNDNDVSETARGFCECGWPYSMLLPRGTPQGERYKLCVYISDNVKDALNARTTCGSMSYCGAQNREYPDARPMGYPFSTKAVIGHKLVTDIPAEFSTLPHASMTSFKIKNTEWDEKYDVEAEVVEPETNMPKVLWPVDTEDDENPMPTHEDYFRSSSFGHMRVVIYDDDCAGDSGENIRIRFKGRGKGNGPYQITDVSIAQRVANLNLKGKVELTLNGQKEFSVPENGIWTDAVKFKFDPALGDHVVSFQVLTGGCALYRAFKRVNTYRLFGDNTNENWKELRDDGKLVLSGRALYCVEKIERL